MQFFQMLSKGLQEACRTDQRKTRETVEQLQEPTRRNLKKIIRRDRMPYHFIKQKGCCSAFNADSSLFNIISI